MSAAMALHVALSLRLDAIEAYRLAHAYRDEELQKVADRLASRATLYGDSRTVNEVIRDLRQIAGAKGSPATATPDFFQAGHTYTRYHHGSRVEFHVRHVSAAPGSSHRVAFGWRLDADGDWEPFDSDDLTGWTDTTQGDSK